jgi:peptidyl-prolyl cis-trans isomerase B (cyclophilin B)
MSSARDNRQRAAARARLEREMAARLATAARRRRLTRNWLGATLVGLLAIGATIWIVTALNTSPTPAAGPLGCTWVPTPTNPAQPSASGSASASPKSSPSSSSSASTSPKPSATATGSASASPGVSTSPALGPLPPANPPTSGFQIMSLTTKYGVIKIQMDYSKTPCTAASMAYLAQKKFYKDTSCHRLVAGIFALQCGDPTGTGSGGPGYQFNDENLPKDQLPAYHDGDVAMANAGANTNGSQFFFVFGVATLPGDYSLWGHVVQGLDIIKKIAADGDDEAFAQSGGGGHPNTPLEFTDVSVTPIGPTPTPTPKPTPSPTPSATASGSASTSASPKSSAS